MIIDVFIKPTEFKDISPVICGKQKCESGHFYGYASRDFYLIHFIISGKGIFKTERGKYNISEGSIFIIKPFELTFYKADYENPWSYCWIGFYATENFKEYLKDDVLKIPELRHIFEDMINSKNIKPGREMYLTGKIYETLSYIESKNDRKTNIEEYISMAKNYILANYMKEISVDKMASHFGFNRSYFSRIFKENTGISPQNFIIQTRLNKAIELMTLYNFSTKQASINVGYNDVFNFSKIFKKRFGISPNNYKNKNLLK